MSGSASREIAISRLREGVLEPISLYVALEPGTRADFEVVARASLEFAITLREVAYVIDPSIELRIEIESGTPGSISLNSILRFLNVTDQKGRLNIKAIALGVGAFFFHETTVWRYDKILDHAFTPQEKAQFTQAEMEEIARKTADAIQRRVGAPQAERVYRELQADPAISGVTVTRGPETEVVLSNIVPRSDFTARSGALRQEIENGSKRTRDELSTLELISRNSPGHLVRGGIDRSRLSTDQRVNGTAR